MALNSGKATEKHVYVHTAFKLVSTTQFVVFYEFSSHSKTECHNHRLQSGVLNVVTENDSKICVEIVE